MFAARAADFESEPVRVYGLCSEATKMIIHNWGGDCKGGFVGYSIFDEPVILKTGIKKKTSAFPRDPSFNSPL